MPLTASVLPVHSLPGDDPLVQVQPIEYPNPYDFTREHRHTYFEVFFFQSGGGSQLIDFVKLPVKAQSCYIVYPQQIHLLKRAPKARGMLVQFGQEAIISPRLKTLLQQQSFRDSPAIIFEQNRKCFTKFRMHVEQLQDAVKNHSEATREISFHLLQALLLQLFSDCVPAIPPHSMNEEQKLLFAFQQRIEQEYPENHQVSKYAAGLSVTEKKLAAVTKKFLGLSPLQVIHNRLLLEARRLLLFEGTSHKEIAFMLGFDSPATFSLFIKNKTGFSPTELNRQLVQIHK